MLSRLLHLLNNQVCSGFKKTTSFLYPFYCFRFFNFELPARSKASRFIWLRQCSLRCLLENKFSSTIFRSRSSQSVLKNSLFRIFRDVVYCSVINVRFCFVVVFRDSHIRLSHLSSLVNNFFNLFFTVLFDSFVSRDSFVRITPLQIKVNTFFQNILLYSYKYNLHEKTGIFL